MLAAIWSEDYRAESNSFSDTLKPLRSKVLTEVGFHIEITTLFDFIVVQSPEKTWVDYAVIPGVPQISWGETNSMKPILKKGQLTLVAFFVVVDGGFF